MIQHYVLMRLEPGYMDDALFGKISERFKSLKIEVPDHVKNVSTYLNCIERDTNMDFMVEMTLTSEASLDVYLKHPTHLALVKEMIPHITSRCSFDYIL